MKKRIILLLCVSMLFVFAEQAFASGGFVVVGGNGTVKIDSPNYGQHMRVLIEKDNVQYQYVLSRKEEELPLQMGKGDYSIKVLENIEGNRYRVVSKEKVSMEKFDEKEVFLASAQPIYWRGKPAEQLAKQLTQGDVDTRKKVESIYNYVTKNIAYDHGKIAGLKDDYIPNIESTLNTMSGICYDYAALTAGMLRSLGIPTKLVKGYKNDLEAYHAWNEVLIDGKWVIIDTTYDSAFAKVNLDVNMIKSNTEYNKTREY